MWLSITELRLWATMKWVWLQMKLLFLSPASVQELSTILKGTAVCTCRLQGLLHVVVQEIPWVYMYLTTHNEL